MSWELNWEEFKENHPFKEHPYSKRNWGNENHSLCSFFGKLKPALSHFLIKTFTTEGGTILDPFSGSGTVPFEGALNYRETFALDINPISIVLTNAKVRKVKFELIEQELADLSDHIRLHYPNPRDLLIAQEFGYNKTLKDYYHPQTFAEILAARSFYKRVRINYSAEYYFVLACLIHILHGNRPYALSRNSHPITPYAPTGDFIYKNTIEKLKEKIARAYKASCKQEVKIEGKVFHGDILADWPDAFQNLDAIITSPPFFDSTRYYLTNWLRSWFLGWEKEDFEAEKNLFVDTLQKKSFDVYDGIIRQCKDRLKCNGVVVFHLGKSHKKDMGQTILPYAQRYFKNVELYNEDVSAIERHGIKDKGSVNFHQYLVMH